MLYFAFTEIVQKWPPLSVLLPDLRPHAWRQGCGRRRHNPSLAAPCSNQRPRDWPDRHIDHPTNGTAVNPHAEVSDVDAL